MKRFDLLLVPAAALAVLILNVAISIGVVWVNSTFVDPGRRFADYQAFAATAAPISGVVAGFPLMLLAGFLLARGRSDRSALVAASVMALVYIAIDLAIMLAADGNGAVWTWAAISYATVLLAALAGARLRTSRSRRESQA